MLLLFYLGSGMTTCLGNSCSFGVLHKRMTIFVFVLLFLFWFLMTYCICHFWLALTFLKRIRLTLQLGYESALNVVRFVRFQ